MNTSPQLRSYYWCEDHLLGNLGDALVPLLLRALGYMPVSLHATGPAVQNPHRGLLVIGSLLTDYDLAAINTAVGVWGCGWKGWPLSPQRQQQIIVHAVRGPHTVTGLGLPADTPLGDPALLLPRLTKLRRAPHGQTIVVPHYHRARLMTVQQRRHVTGCDEVVSPLVFQAQGIRRRGWGRQALAMSKGWLRLGLRPFTPWAAVERLAGATFVLTGSLHGAILAQAYGVPWAAYDDGYIDARPKWLDWAAYLGITIAFVSTLAAGRQWWQTEGQRGAVRDLQPLLQAFPYPLPIHLRK